MLYILRMLYKYTKLYFDCILFNKPKNLFRIIISCVDNWRHFIHNPNIGNYFLINKNKDCNLNKFVEKKLGIQFLSSIYYVKFKKRFIHIKSKQKLVL